MKIVLAGGSGYLGSVMTAYYAKGGNEIIVLSRKAQPDNGNVRTIEWDAKTTGPWCEALEGADLLINFTGRNVNCRYNEENKREILESRLDSTSVLGTAIRRLKRAPKVWIQSASATIYRHAEDRFMDEVNGEIGEGFSVEVCKRWEEEFQAQPTPHTRKVLLRTGIVLGRGGGVMPRLINLVKSGLGGKQGNGKQYISWIHEQDLAGIIDWLYKHPLADGVFNCTGPNPVRNKYFMDTLRTLCKVPLGFPSPKWLLEIGAWLIGTETELILKSRWVMPARLLEAGYEFRFPTLGPALWDIVNNRHFA